MLFLMPKQRCKSTEGNTRTQETSIYLLSILNIHQLTNMHLINILQITVTKVQLLVLIFNNHYFFIFT